MGAILGGTMRSPLTGIVFAFELTHDANVFLPLLIGSVVAHGFTVLTLRRSILTEKVSRRGYHLSREYAVDPLELLYAREVMQTNFLALPVDKSVSESLSPEESVVQFAQRLLPVIDSNGVLVGVLTRSEIQRRLSEDGATPKPHFAGEFAQRNPVVAFANEPLRIVVHRMAESGFTRLPVVSPDSHRMLGIISLDDLLKARVRHLEDERRRDQVFRFRPRSPGNIPTEAAKSTIGTE
jgi:chloride channel protein, CIC family